MSHQQSRIVQELLDEPHVEGRRIPVLTIVERVEGQGLNPRTVAERYALDTTEVYAALLYYHDNPELFDSLRTEREQLMEAIEEDIDRPDDVTPPNA